MEGRCLWRYGRIFDWVEKYKELILDSERYIWEHPESGYREWNTHEYMKGIFERFGYSRGESN